MIIQRMAEGIRTQNWFTVIVEILIVVIGIFLGLQVTEWNQEREDIVAENQFFDRLITDLEHDLTEFEDTQRSAQTRLELIDFLIGAMAGETVDEAALAGVARAVQEAGFSRRAIIADHTFEELKSSGNLNLIRSTELRKKIFAYYGSVSFISQYEFMSQHIQNEYQDRRTTILTADQTRRLWAGATSVGSTEIGLVSKEEARAILARAMAKPEFIEWLPTLIGFQSMFISGARRGQRRATELIEALKEPKP